MLDIIIAIFLIYALFAGLISGINELIAQMAEMRGKVLYEGIAMMLGELPKASGVKRFTVSLLRKFGFVEPSLKPGAHLTQALYDHPLVDTLSQPGSKPSYISPASFSSALVQVLSNGSLSSLRQKLDHRDSSLGKLLGPMLDEANGDMEKFKAKVENHFNEVMDRVGGWYKRRTQAIMLFLGFFLAVLFNVDSIYIVQRLQNDPELAARLVQVAEKVSEKSTDQASENNDAVQSQALKNQLEQLNHQIQEFKSFGLPIGWVAPSDEATSYFAVAYQPLQNPFLSWFGWFLTALAGALGAPFWFDALSNLFAIRGTGKKPEESKITALTPASPTIQVIVPPVADGTFSANDAALNDYEINLLKTKDIERLQRILGIPESRTDARFSKELRAALREWQRISGRAVTGQFDEATVRTLFESEGIKKP